jgi:D-aminopeptidase
VWFPWIRDQYTLGALVLANMGKKKDLTVCGRHLGPLLGPVPGTEPGPVPDGSIIIILATDLPLCERQLGRIARRAQTGVARTGSNIDSGSGEMVVAFSTASRIRHYEHRAVVTLPRVNEDRLNSVFRAVAECTEEAVLNALVMAATTTGRNGGPCILWLIFWIICVIRESKSVTPFRRPIKKPVSPNF